MANPQFDLLESKVTGLLRLHRQLVSENRKLRRRLEEQEREVLRMRENDERTQVLKKALLERIDKLLKDVDH